MANGWGSSKSITVTKSGQTVAGNGSTGWGAGSHVSTGTGWSSLGQKPQAPAKKSGGSFLGKLTGGVSKIAGDVAHTTAQIGTGVYLVGANEVQAVSDDLHGRNKAVNNAAWSDLLHLHPVKALQEYKNAGTPAARNVAAIDRSIIGSTVHPIQPGHPFQTALNLAGDVALGAGAAARAANVARAISEGADAGTIAKASVLRPTYGPRFLKVPKLVAPAGEGPAALTSEAVQIPGSQGAVARGLQKAHDFAVQKSLDRIPVTGKASTIARYGLRRVGMSVDEGQRIVQNLRESKAVALERAGHDSSLTKPEASLSIFLRSANVLPEEAANAWGRLGTNQGNYMAQLARSVEEKGVLAPGPDGRLAVNAQQYPKLAHADALTQGAQTERERILLRNELMTPEGLATRKNLVAETLGSEFARNPETGIREGQGYTNLQTSKPAAPGSAVARSVGSVIPRAKKLSVGKEATGLGVAKGLIPANTKGEVAASLRQANRFQNTTDLRAAASQLGSDVRQTTKDVLIAAPGKGSAPELTPELKTLVGKLTDSTLAPDEEIRLSSKLHQFANDHLIQVGRDDSIGTRAPAGWKWVHPSALPDSLGHAIAPRGKTGRVADALNSAVTSATVYTKIGHLPQRFLTNATTNFIQGGLSPVALAKTFTTARHLSDDEKLALTALTGTHGSAAPLAATVETKGRVAGTVVGAGGKLAGVWARRVDAPFRLNSVLTELRGIGINTPDEIRSALRAIENPAGSPMNTEELARLDGAVRRANRAAMIYDGLSNTEKRVVARYVWFYPWIKASVRFAGHTVSEHPYKAGILGQLGAQGERYTQQRLGDQPSFEENLTPWSGGAFPLVANLSSLTPYGTPADIANLLTQPLNPDNGIGSMANPVAGAGLALLKGQGATGAIQQLFGPTPEYQAFEAGKHPARDRSGGFFPTSNQRLFGSTLASALLRAAGGTATPRRVNRSKLNLYAQREHERKRTLTIYSK